nr:hypothetical protein [Tanacetum cinerariifolium]
MQKKPSVVDIEHAIGAGIYKTMTSNDVLKEFYAKECIKLGKLLMERGVVMKADDTTAKNSFIEPKEENRIPPVIVLAGTSEEKPRGCHGCDQEGDVEVRAHECRTKLIQVPLSMKELAKKELKLLEAQYPSGYQYLKLQLKEFIHVLEGEEQEKEDKQAFIKKQ